MSNYDVALLILSGVGLCIAAYGLFLGHQIDRQRREDQIEAQRGAPHPAE